MNYHCFNSYDLTNQSESSLKVAMTTPYICKSRTGCCTSGVSNVYWWLW